MLRAWVVLIVVVPGATALDLQVDGAATATRLRPGVFRDVPLAVEAHMLECGPATTLRVDLATLHGSHLVASVDPEEGPGIFDPSRNVQRFETMLNLSLGMSAPAFQDQPLKIVGSAPACVYRPEANTTVAIKADIALRTRIVRDTKFLTMEAGTEAGLVLQLQNLGNGDIKVDTTLSADLPGSDIRPPPQGILIESIPTRGSKAESEVALIAAFRPPGPGTYNVTWRLDIRSATDATDAPTAVVTTYSIVEVSESVPSTPFLGLLLAAIGGAAVARIRARSEACTSTHAGPPG